MYRCKPTGAALWLWLLACTAPPRTQPEPPHDRDTRPEIIVLRVRDDSPAGGDGKPRYALALRFPDGAQVPIAGEATAFVPFRRGVALVDADGQLVLVAADGARSVLARQAGAPPAHGPRGELVYVARQELIAEVHVLDEDGRDRIVATDLADAGVLAPQPDGRVFFVAARSGGVAGVWLAEHEGARCLTNCELRTGAAWGSAYVPLPSTADSIRAGVRSVAWNAADGTRRSVDLAAITAAPIGSDATKPQSGNAATGAP